MRKSILVTAAALGLCIGMAAAESVHFYGGHFWDFDMDLDLLQGKTGWSIQKRDTWNAGDAINLGDRRWITDEGFTIVHRFDGHSRTIPEDEYMDRWASYCAYWATANRAYSNIYVVGNEGEEWSRVKHALLKVRREVHAVEPNAIICIGSPPSSSYFDSALNTIGVWLDGLVTHGNVPISYINVMENRDNPVHEDYLPGFYGRSKPVYITEYGGLPTTDGSMTAYTNEVRDWNNTQNHKVECRTFFVYWGIGNEWSSMKLLPMQNADLEDSYRNEYYNSYVLPRLQITGRAVTPTGETTATVSWTTDYASTTQVEWWMVDGGEKDHQLTLDDIPDSTSHSVGITGLEPGREYEYQIRTYALGRPLTITSAYSYVHIPDGTGSISGLITDEAGSPIDGCTVTRTPGGYSRVTDAAGAFEFLGVPPGDYTLSVEAGAWGDVDAFPVAVTAPAEKDSVQIALSPLPNLLSNGSFESGATGWTITGSDGIIGGTWFGDITARSGNAFWGSASSGGRKPGLARQTATVTPGLTCRAEGFSRLYRGENPECDVLARVGVDPTGGTDPEGAFVVWSDTDSQFREWTSEWRNLRPDDVLPGGSSVTVFADIIQMGGETEEDIAYGWHINAFDDMGLYDTSYKSGGCPDGWLHAGWNMISVPLVGISSAAGDVLDTAIAAGNDITNAVYRYVPGSGYELYPSDFTTLDPGIGYWVYLTVASGEGVAGTYASDRIALASGWNLIGHPQPVPVPLTDVILDDGVTQLGWDDAQSAGWIDGVAFDYDGGYRIIRTSGGDDDSFRPWRAYWMLVNVSGLEIVIPAP